MSAHDDHMLQRALENPAAAFGSPGEVVQAANLSVAARRRILQRWKEECVAARQNSHQGGDADRLDEVDAALNAVGELATARTAELS